MEPSYYAEGYTPRASDTRLRVWSKILGAYQANGGLVENNPRRTDTLRQITEKLNRAINGTT